MKTAEDKAKEFLDHAKDKVSYFWESDPGHAWLAVPMSELKESGVLNTISSCSYISRDGTMAYLEEDCDAGKFIDSLPDHKMAVFKDIYREHSFIRDLPCFNGKYLQHPGRK